MKYINGTLSLFLMTILSQNSLAIENDLQFFSPSNVTLDFDPFTGLPEVKLAELEFTLPSGEARSVKLTITPETEPDFEFDSGDVPVQLEIISDTGTQIVGQFERVLLLQPGQMNLMEVNFKISAGQYANSGTHQLNLLINIEDTVSGEQLLANKPLRIDCVVPSRAQTNFAGAAPGFDNGVGIATLDFGEIVFDDSRQVQFQIRGNSDVIVEMSSENSGYMVNQENADISPIPYIVDADGVISDMRTPLMFTRRPEKSLAGSRYPLKVTIKEPEGGAYAGEYRDILSIDVTPR